MKFELIKFSEFNKKKFAEHATWAQYYEPDDMNTLERLGFDKRIISEKLESVGWSDEYWFPFPDETEIGSFKFEHRKAVIKTLSGRVFDGYVINSGHAIGVFGNSDEWVINIQLIDLFEEDEANMRLDLGMDKNELIFPLKVEITSKGLFLTIKGKS